jgi:hypothetical protein
MMISLLKAVQAGAAAGGANFRPTSAEDERAFREKSEAAITEAIFVSSLFTYRSFSDAEMVQYIDYLKSPSAMTFQEALTAGLNASMSDAARHVGVRLAELKPPKRPKN